MKKKSFFRIGAVLLSAGFVMNTAGGKTGRIVQAADIGEVSEIVSEDINDGEDTGSQEADDVLNDGEISEEQPDITDDISEPETENGAATEAAPTSVILNPDSDLGTAPAAFFEYLSDLDVCSVTLIYSDGSEKMLDKEDGRYECSVEHGDETDADGTVRRTYHAVVKELATGAVFEDTESVEIGRKDPVEIKTEDMTTVMLEGRKKWIMVQSVPDVSGRYAMNCDKGIEKIYYVSDDGELTCAEDDFQLQAGEKYTFLIKLK